MANNSIHHQTSRILIVGAGISGLLLAQGLKQLKVPYIIVEAEEREAHRRAEWSMSVHWSAPLLTKILPPQLFQRLVSHACVDPSYDYTLPTTTRIYDGVSGELMKNVDVFDHPSYRVSRRKFRALLTEGIDVKYGHSLVDISYNNDQQTVTATFDNGEVETACLVVGTDGPASTVRKLLVGYEEAEARPLSANVTAIAGSIFYHDAEKSRFIRENSHPICSLAVHPELVMFLATQDVPDVNAPETWSFFSVLTWKGKRDPSSTREDLLRIAKGKGKALAEPFRSAVEWIPDTAQFAVSDFRHWEARKPVDTHNGRIILAGDAAHPMPPMRGQGLNHAIQDIFNIFQLFSEAMSATDTHSFTTSAERHPDPNEPNSGVEEDAIRIINCWREKMQTCSEEILRRGGTEVGIACRNVEAALNYQAFFDSTLMKEGVGRTKNV